MKKNKNGFTLIELLAVIVILGVIMVIATTNVIKSINNSREKSKEIAKKEIVSYAEAYFATNNSNTNNGCVSVEELYKLGYLTDDVTNPETGDNIKNEKELRNQSICKPSATGIPKNGNKTEINGYIYIITPKDSNDSTDDNSKADDNKDDSTDDNSKTDDNKHDSNDATEDNKKQDLNKEDNKKQDSNVSKTYKIGDRFCLKSECFYVIKDNGTTVDALAKQNINIKTNRQDKKFSKLTFSETTYWSSSMNKYGSSYPLNVFDSNSALYEPVQNYKTYLKSTLGKASVDARLITYNELISLGCSRNRNDYGYCYCKSAPSWVYTIRYWTASACNNTRVWIVSQDGYLDDVTYNYPLYFGLRPVITINKNEI